MPPGGKSDGGDASTAREPLAAEGGTEPRNLESAELSTVQIRMAVDIGRKSAARREAFLRGQLAQLGREIREALDTKLP